MNLKNIHAHKNSFWDWTPLNDCFGGTSIRVTDIDGFVERNGRFLVLETKSPKEEIPQGQSLTFDALVRTGLFTIIVVWGARNVPREIKVFTRDTRNNKHYMQDVSMGLLQKIVSQWFTFANNQQTNISLPKQGSHVNAFRWNDSTLLVRALGHEGPCRSCETEMRKGDYFRVADGAIMHLECVRDWESRKVEPTNPSYELPQRLRPRA